MTTIERYKKMYSEPNDSDNIVLQNNKAIVPTWFAVYLLHGSGIKSRKKRIVKKILKTQLKKLILNYVESKNREN
jgi:hypothetical protein